MAGLGGLAFVGEGYEQGLLDYMKASEAKDQLLGRQAFGRTLMALSGQDPNAGLSPSVPSPAGGAGALPVVGAGGSIPGATPMPGPAAGPAPSPMFAARPPGAPPMGVPAGPPVTPPAARAPMPAGPGVAAGPPGPGQPYYAGGNQFQPMGPGGGVGGAFDWRTILGAVMKANPGASPSVLAAAVDQFMPLMNQQAQLQWREQSLMLREQALMMAQDRFTQNQDRLRSNQEDLERYRTEQGGRADRRLDQGDVRLGQGQERVEQGNRRLDQGDRRLDQGDRRLTETERRNQASEALRKRGQDLTMERFKEGLEVRKDANSERVRHNMATEAQQLANQIQRAEQAGDRNALTLLQQQNRALWERTNKEIQISTNIGDEAEKKRLRQENDDRYTQVQRQIDAVRQGIGKGNAGFGDRFNAATEKPLTQGPAGMAVPDQYKDQPDGTVFHMSNGRDMIKRGDRLVPVSEDNGQR